MISYLPAFVTVGIIQSIRRPARAALGLRLLKERKLTILLGIPTSISRSLPANMPPPTPGRPVLTVRTEFSVGQRYWGTSVSHSIRCKRHLPGVPRFNILPRPRRWCALGVNQGFGIDSRGDVVRSGIGTLVSRTGRSTSPGRAGASSPSVSRYPCSAMPLVQTLSSAEMYSICNS